jgi:hypothetical protein
MASADGKRFREGPTGYVLLDGFIALGRRRRGDRLGLYLLLAHRWL